MENRASRAVKENEILPVKLFFPISFLAAVAVLSGCASYEDDAQKLRAEWARGNFAAAAAVAGTALEESDGNDRLLWQMERASTLRALGNAEEASSAFEAAAGTLAHWNETPEILLSREALAGLTNLSALPYHVQKEEEYPFPSTKRYFELARGIVGAGKLLWGTDIPWLLGTANYQQLVAHGRFLLTDCTEKEQDMIFAENAWSVYWNHCK